MLSLKTVNSIAFITIENQSRLKVVLSSLGASVFAIYFNDELMTLSLKDKIDFSNPDLYHGKTIGPVCGRIAYGKIDEYRYETNEENVARHGGKNGLSTQLFNYRFEEKTDTVSVIFSFQGFIVEYVVNQKEDSFIVNYLYQEKEQPVSLSNHLFFHLGNSLDKLSLKLQANAFVENNPLSLVPLKERELLPCLDFSNGKSVIKDIYDPYLMNNRTKGYDHYLRFSDRKELFLSNDKYVLSITTDFDGVLIYSDNYDFKEETIDDRKGIRKALAVEPQDSPLERKKYGDNHPYHRFIKYTFSKK